jgi:hypothetical protein
MISRPRNLHWAGAGGLAGLVAALVCLANNAGAASVGPTGYTFGSDAVVTLSPTWHVQSPFRVTPGARAGNHFTLQFPAAAGNDYSVLCRDALDSAYPWNKLLDVAAPLQSGPVQVTDSNAPPVFRFYRVVTPSEP